MTNMQQIYKVKQSKISVCKKQFFGFFVYFPGIKERHCLIKGVMALVTSLVGCLDLPSRCIAIDSYFSNLTKSSEKSLFYT